MKTIFLLLVAVLMTVVSHAQFKKLNAPDNYIPDGFVDLRDQLIIDFGNGEKMELNYNWYNVYREDEEYLKKFFLFRFEKMLAELESEIQKIDFDEGKYYILYEIVNSPAKGKDVTGTITVKKREEPENIDKYKMVNGVLESKLEYQHIIELHYLKRRFWDVKFYINDLNDLSSLNIDYFTFFRNETPHFLDKQLYKQNRRYYADFRGDSLQIYHSQKIGKRYPFVALKLYPSAGVTFLKSRYSTDFGILLGASIDDHQPGSNIRIGLRYQLKAVGDEDYMYGRAYYNGFVDLLVDGNMGKDYYSKQEWIGFGVGYLVHQEGDAYWKNTARLFFKYRSSKLWGVQPEFNYSFKEKRGYIALGVFVAL